MASLQVGAQPSRMVRITVAVAAIRAAPFSIAQQQCRSRGHAIARSRLELPLMRHWRRSLFGKSRFRSTPSPAERRVKAIAGIGIALA